MKTAVDYNNKAFSAVDYALFGIILTTPALVGVYFAYKDRMASTTTKYFYGGKKMNPIAVGISTAVTSISAVTMIAYPAEVYLVGTVFFWAPLAIVSAASITYFYYVPFYSKLQLDTLYGYLGIRFNLVIKRIVAAMVIISEIFYMGTIIYIPALAMNAVTPIEIAWSILLISGICTFYTVLGGMNAVVWTDVIQSIFMITASILLFVVGTVSLGGLDELASALERGNRSTFTKFENFDISSRMHPAALFIGEFFVFTHYLGFSQPIYQRILSCKNTRQSKNSIIAYVIPALAIICVSIANGFLLYAYFEGCDPIRAGFLRRSDQMVPFMALLLFSEIPGITGVFLAAVFSGTLSTISSGLNGYSAVMVEDFGPMFFQKMSEKTKVRAGKICALGLGVCVTSIAYGISAAGQNVFKLMRCFTGSNGGCILGIFLLGIFIPWTSSLGAAVGGICAYILMIWIFLGSNYLLTAPPRVSLPPISTNSCSINNATLDYLTKATTEASTSVVDVIFSTNDGYSFDQILYSINFHYYVLLGSTLTVVIGTVVSFLTGPQNPAESDPRLFMPIISNPNLPVNVLKFFRCGVPQQMSNSRHDVETASDDQEMKPLTE